jgi:hypothetical protein
MLIRTKQTFPKHYVEINAKYYCKCGHKFYRKNRDWFTVNPLNTMDFNQSREELKNRLKKKIRACPKCGNKIKPQ